jgi:MFS family permease
VRTLPGTRRGGGTLLAVLLTGQAMATMDNSIVAVAAPTIRRTLGAGDAAIQLVLAGYTLAFAVMVVTGARLGDRYGHGRVFRLGLVGFTATSLACGLAPNPESLIVSRVLQGATGALMVPQVLTLIQLNFAGARRARAVALYSMVLALGVAGGQVVGGLTVALNLTGAPWRPAFLLNLPVGMGLLVAAGRHLPRHPSGSGARLDVVGVAVLSVAMAALMAPVVIGRDQGWPGWAAGAVFGIGLVGLAAFRAYERRLASRGAAPLVDFDVLRPPGIRPGLLACFLIMGCYAAFLFTLTLHLQDGLGYGPLPAGLAFLPYPVGFAVLSLGADRLPGHVRSLLPVSGPLVFAVAVVVLATVVVAAGGWSWPAVPLLFVAGAGHAAGFSPLFARILARVEPNRAATLSGMGSTGALLAAVAGVAAVGSAYLAVTGGDADRSAAGFGTVAAILAGCLVVGAYCAGRGVRGTRTGAAG